MTKQFKNHPFVDALNAIAPIVMPSFEVLSVRDGAGEILKGPTLEYAIVSIPGNKYEKSTRKWTTTYNIGLGLCLLETNAIDWCKYKELEDAQDRQALFSRLQELLQNFIVLLIEPSSVSKDIKNSDTLYGKYNFKFTAFRDGNYYAKKGKQDLTGLMIDFDIACYTGEQSICCIDNGSPEAAKELQGLVKEGSTSYRLLQNRIDP